MLVKLPRTDLDESLEPPPIRPVATAPAPVSPPPGTGGVKPPKPAVSTAPSTPAQEPGSPGPGWVRYGDGWVPPNHPLALGQGTPAVATTQVPVPSTTLPGGVKTTTTGLNPATAQATGVDLSQYPYLGALKGFEHTKLSNPQHTTIKYQLGRLFAKYPPTPEGYAALAKDPDFGQLGVQVLGNGNIKLPDGTVVDVVQGFQQGGGAWWWGPQEGTGSVPAPGPDGSTPGPGGWYDPGGSGGGNWPGSGGGYNPVPPGGTGPYLPGMGTQAPGQWGIPGYDTLFQSTDEFSDPATSNFEDLLNWRVQELLTPMKDPTRQQYADLLQQYTERLGQPDPAITNMIGTLENQANQYLQRSPAQGVAEEQIAALQGMPAGYQEALQRLMGSVQNPTEGETLNRRLAGEMTSLPAGYQQAIDQMMAGLQNPSESENLNRQLAGQLSSLPAGYQQALDQLMGRLGQTSQTERMGGELAQEFRQMPQGYQSALQALDSLLQQQTGSEQMGTGLAQQFQSLPAEYAAQAQERIKQLQADPYTGAEWEAYRTGALDPIESDRKNAQDRITAEIAQRGMDPSSGIAQQMRLEADRTFDQARAVEQGTLTRSRAAERMSRQGQAFDVQSALQNLLQQRQMQGLTMQTAADQMGLSRGQNRLGAQSSAATLAGDRAAQAMGFQQLADMSGQDRLTQGLGAQSGAANLLQQRQAAASGLMGQADTDALRRRSLGIDTQGAAEGLLRQRQNTASSLLQQADTSAQQRALTGLGAQTEAEALGRTRGNERTALAQQLADWTGQRGERAAQLYGTVADIPVQRGLQQLQAAEQLSSLGAGVRGEEQSRRSEALALQGLLTELPERRLQLALATLGQGSTPESMMGSLTNLANSSNQRALAQAQQSSANWGGIGSLAALLGPLLAGIGKK